MDVLITLPGQWSECMYNLKELQDCTYFLLHCKGANLVDSTKFNIVFRSFLRY